ncbi:MAG: nicotinate-nucleotide--dimethylbenzimidazole phosphoribosyltransferase [Actinobacteria bacterium]|nr:nicotinate-nucleotide--dimethylbenzimidazole phosphoribosyltransferase [Actinomycetota bacterium]
MEIRSIVEKIKGLDSGLMEKAQVRLDNLTKPKGSLGRLEELAKQIVGIKGNSSPKIEKKFIITMAGDHGVTDEKISAYPREVTYQMVYNFLRGGAAINVLARHVGARVIVVDVGVAYDIEDAIGGSNYSYFISKKIDYGTKNMAKGPAMTYEQATSSIEAGISIVEELVSEGCDIIGTGDMGIGNTTASSAIISVICNVDPSIVTGYGTGLDEKGLARKVEVIKRAISVNKPDRNDAIDVLAKVGGYEIGGIAGVILGAAANRIPVVIDGFISGAAALIAYSIAPHSKNFMIASHCSVERGHKVVLNWLGLKPLLDFDMRLGEGTGATLGISIVEASVKILNEMATFGEAGVSEKETPNLIQ